MDNNIGAEGAAELAVGLSLNRMLTRLGVGGNNLGSQGVVALAQSIAAQKALTAIDFSANGTGSDGVTLMTDALATQFTITALDIRSNAIGDVGVQLLSEALKSNTVLEFLDVSDNSTTGGASGHLQSLLADNYALQDIIIAGEDSQRDDLLSRNRYISSVCKPLQINDETFTSLVVHEIQLKHSKYRLRDHDWECIDVAMSHNHVLTSINLSDSALCGQTANSLGRYAQTHTALTDVNLSNNTGIGDDISFLASAIAAPESNLSTVRVAGVGMGLQGASTLFAALAVNKTASFLSISDNSLGAEGAAVLAASLQSNATLSELDMSDIRAGGAGIKHVLSAMLKQGRRSLKHDGVDKQTLLKLELGPRVDVQGQVIFAPRLAFRLHLPLFSSRGWGISSPESWFMRWLARPSWR